MSVGLESHRSRNIAMATTRSIYERDDLTLRFWEMKDTQRVKMWMITTFVIIFVVIEATKAPLSTFVNMTATKSTYMRGDLMLRL